MTDSDAAKTAELLEEIEQEWAAADRVRGRVIRPARQETDGDPQSPTAAPVRSGNVD